MSQSGRPMAPKAADQKQKAPDDKKGKDISDLHDLIPEIKDFLNPKDLGRGKQAAKLFSSFSVPKNEYDQVVREIVDRSPELRGKQILSVKILDKDLEVNVLKTMGMKSTYMSPAEKHEEVKVLIPIKDVYARIDQIMKEKEHKSGPKI